MCRQKLYIGFGTMHGFRYPMVVLELSNKRAEEGTIQQMISYANQVVGPKNTKLTSLEIPREGDAPKPGLSGWLTVAGGMRHVPGEPLKDPLPLPPVGQRDGEVRPPGRFTPRHAHLD